MFSDKKAFAGGIVMWVKNRSGTASFLWVLLLTWLGLGGCAFWLQSQEVLEGSNAWIQELTQGIKVSPQYSSTVARGVPWDFSLQIENRGRYEPHLELLWIEVVSGPEEWTCDVREPRVDEVQRFDTFFLFRFQPYRIARGQKVVVRASCRFSQAGVYEMLWNASFEESGVPFFSEKIILEVR